MAIMYSLSKKRMTFGRESGKLYATAQCSGVVREMDCFELYRLYDDDSEGLIENRQELEEAMERGTLIGIEVGFLPPELKLDKCHE